MNNDIYFITQWLAVFLAVIFCFKKADKALKGKLNQLIEWLFKQLIKQTPFLYKIIKERLQTLSDARPKPSAKTQRVLAWGTIVSDVLFAALMFIVAISFIAVACDIHDNTFKFLFALMFSALFLFLSWIYASFAHETANKNGINKYPWKPQVKIM